MVLMAGKKTKQTNQQNRRRDAARDEESYDRLGFFESIKKETLRGVLGVTLFVVAIILTLAAMGLAGVAGDKLFSGVTWVVGIGFYLVPVMLIAWALTFFKREEEAGLQPVRTTGGVLGFLSVLGTLGVLTPEHAGALGNGIAYPLVKYLDNIAALIVLAGLIIISLLLLFDSELWVLLGRKFLGLFRAPNVSNGEDGGTDVLPDASSGTDANESPYYEAHTEDGTNDDTEVDGEETYEPPVARVARARVDARSRKDTFVLPSTYNPPPLSLLEGDRGTAQTDGDTKVKANTIQKTLQNFNISVNMDETTVGPSVTQYTLKPAAGVKLNKITSLQPNLELALAASPIRIEAPIPGRSVVGIEVPNTSKRTVGLGGLLSSPEFTEESVPLFIALGKDIAGNAHFANIGKMPHLLVAGTTGVGKSVMIHSIITALLYRNGPERLRLILVDPKHVELTKYNGIPHLLTPVITDAKKCIAALTWAGKEMDKRYKVLEEHGAVGIDEYHADVLAPAYTRAHTQGDDIDADAELSEPMPHIMIVIDELSDIMSAHPRELEGAIVRLAQKSRAVGIHLVLSTQRPSAQVITGLIKANIPTRIALKVTSLLESRIILDQGGAEELLGAGDMLYLSPDMAKPRRLQAPFLTTGEVKEVVKYLKQHNEPQLDTPLEFPDDASGAGGSGVGGDGGERDALYVEIRDFVLATRRASTSLLQRKFNIGYGRAARIMDFLEEDGIIAPSDGSNRPRTVLSGGNTFDAGHDAPSANDDERGYA